MTHGQRIDRQRRVSAWGTKPMRIQWGPCSETARCVWLNLELAKKPVECPEYVVMHGMAHFRERHHNG